MPELSGYEKVPSRTVAMMTSINCCTRSTFGTLRLGRWLQKIGSLADVW